MSNDWIVLEEVGKWAGLEGDDLDSYLRLASQVHNRAVEQSGQEYEMDTEYFQFLNQEVLSSPEVEEVITNQGLSPEKLSAIRTGNVDFEEFLNETHLVDYTLDEIVDFVMVLKLIDGYRSRVEDTQMQLDKLYYLAFTVNYRLSKSDDIVRFEDSLGIGNLQRTGYRYSFIKQGGYPFSESLERDKNRLIAWNLLNESTTPNLSNCEYPFELSIGERGEFFFTRYEQKMNQFDSLLLKTWENEQREVLDDFAAEPIESLHSYLQSIDLVQQAQEGNVVLHGRPMNFTENDEQSEQGEFNAHA